MNALSSTTTSTSSKPGLLPSKYYPAAEHKNLLPFSAEITDTLDGVLDGSKYLKTSGLSGNYAGNWWKLSPEEYEAWLKARTLWRKKQKYYKKGNWPAVEEPLGEYKLMATANKSCSVCGWQGESVHWQAKCSICNQVYACQDAKMHLEHHLKGNKETHYLCKMHGWVNPETHPNKCHCGATASCDTKWHNGHCFTCGEEEGICHHWGECKDPNCPRRPKASSIFQIRSNPQQAFSTLNEWGLTRGKDGDQAINIGEEAATFYALVAFADKSNPEHKKLLDDILPQMASAFQKAIASACAGEVRYASEKYYNGLIAGIVNRHRSHGRNLQATYLREVQGPSLFGPQWRYSRPFGADDWQNAIQHNRGESNRNTGSVWFKRTVIDPYGYTHGMRILRNWFRFQTWGSTGGEDIFEPSKIGSVGGPTWQYAAEVGHRYATGKISTVTFLDTCFNLQHNNANLFTKTHGIPRDFQGWLDQRRNADLDWIRGQAPKWVLKALGVSEALVAPDGETFVCSFLSGESVEIATRIGEPDAWRPYNEPIEWNPAEGFISKAVTGAAKKTLAKVNQSKVKKKPKVTPTDGPPTLQSKIANAFVEVYEKEYSSASN